MKTRRRLKLLLIAAIAMTLLLAGGYALRKRQLAARALRSRDEGYAALTAGDYFNAMHKIGVFVQRNPNDAEALAKYAKARCNVEEPNAKHLLEGISLYRRVLELEPDNDEANTSLLQLYLNVGFNTEILTRTAQRTDVSSLRARARAQASLGKMQEARETAIRYVQQKPADLEMQQFVCILLLRAPEQGDVAPEQQVLNRVTDLLKKYPNEPRYELLMGYANQETGNTTAALEWTRKAATRSLNETELVDAVVAQLDGLQKYDESLAMLDRATSATGDLAFRRRVITRLFQSGKLGEAQQRLADLTSDMSKADVELLALKAMALSAAHRDDLAKPVIDALAARQGDLSAKAWAQVLNVVPAQGEIADERQVMNACRDGLRIRSSNPYFHCYLGDAYARLGEGEAAIREWTEAVRAAPVWGAPVSRLLRTMVSTGARNEDVRDVADRLLATAGTDADALASVALARARLGATSGATDTDEVQQLVDRAQRLRPGEEMTLSLRLSRLSRSGKSEEATELAKKLIATEPPLPEASLLAIANASEALKLGVEQTCFARCRAVHGNTWRLSLSHASYLIRSGRAEEAVKLFEAARAEASDRDALGWQIAWAKVLDGAKDDRAAKQWAEFSKAHPTDVTAQLAVLTARAVQSDRELVRRAIDQLGGVIGDAGVSWRLADARWTMQSATLKNSPREREEDVVKAAAILSQITRVHPEHLQARVLLGDCMLRLKKKDAAAEQLVAAAKLAPNSFEISLQAASILQSLGDFERAKPLLDQSETALNSVANVEQTTPAPTGAAGTREETSSIPAANGSPSAAAGWRRLATLLAARGETTRAITILEKLDRDAQPEIEATLASLRSPRGELTAEDCQRLLAKPTPANIGIVADFYASSGRKADADTTIAMLSQVKAEKGEREFVRGAYYARHGSPEQAVAELRTACAEAPSNRRAWVALIATQLDGERAADAISTATDAQKALPDDKSFQLFVEQAELIRSLVDNTLARRLIAELPADNNNGDMLIEALRVMRDGESSKRSIGQVAAELKPLADRAPTLLPIQTVLIDMYMGMGSFEEAAGVATRTMQLVPADPQVAQRAAEAFAAAEKWDQSLAVAREWRKRLGSKAWPADQLISAVLVAARRGGEAIAQLEQYRQEAKNDPETWATFYSIYANALVDQGRLDDAKATFEPVLRVGPALRIGYINTVQRIPSTHIAVQWLDHVAPLLASSAVDEHLEFARAWEQLAVRGDEGLLERGRAVLTEEGEVLQRSADTKAGEWGLLASMMERVGDDVGAEAGYRRALQLNPDDALAQNNLAMVIMRRKGDPREAEQLATRAAAHADHVNRADFLDTLARIKVGAGDYAAGEAAVRQAIQLRPADRPLRAYLVEMLLAAGKAKQANTELDELDKLIGQSAKPDKNLQDRSAQLREQARRALSSASN